MEWRKTLLLKLNKAKLDKVVAPAGRKSLFAKHRFAADGAPNSGSCEGRNSLLWVTTNKVKLDEVVAPASLMDDRFCWVSVALFESVLLGVLLSWLSDLFSILSYFSSFLLMFSVNLLVALSENLL